MKYLDVPQSGSQANTVASRNRFGQYFRTRAIPTNPNTNLQSTVRLNLGTLASQWASLTPSQHASWDACAKKFPKKDSLGQTIVLSAFQQFIRSNTALFMTSGFTQLSPAADLPFSNALIDATVIAGPTKKFDIGYIVPKTNQFLVVDTSPPVSPGISYWSDYRNLAIQSSGATPPADELAKFELKYGPLVPGQKIFFRSRALNECGVYGPAFLITTIVGPVPALLVAKGVTAKKA